jgi:hypothetical protein
VFARKKKSGRHEYLQVVSNDRVDGRVRQKVIATLGRVDELVRRGHIDSFLQSCARFARRTAVLDEGTIEQPLVAETARIGPALVFGALWQELGLAESMSAATRSESKSKSKSGTPDAPDTLQRAALDLALHSLFPSGRQLPDDEWRRDYGLDAFDGAGGPGHDDTSRAVERLGGCRLEIESAIETRRAGARETGDDRSAPPKRQRSRRPRNSETSGPSMLVVDATVMPVPGKGAIAIGLLRDVDGTLVGSDSSILMPTGRDALLALAQSVETGRRVETICLLVDREDTSRRDVDEILDLGSGIRSIVASRLALVTETLEECASNSDLVKSVSAWTRDPSAPTFFEEFRSTRDGRRLVVKFDPGEIEKDRRDRQISLPTWRDPIGAAWDSDSSRVRPAVTLDGVHTFETDTSIDAARLSRLYTVSRRKRRCMRSFRNLIEMYPTVDDGVIRGQLLCRFLALVLLDEVMSRIERAGPSVDADELLDQLDELLEIRLRTSGRRLVLRTAARRHVACALRWLGIESVPIGRDPDDSDVSDIV